MLRVGKDDVSVVRKSKGAMIVFWELFEVFEGRIGTYLGGNSRREDSESGTLERSLFTIAGIGN